jgi:hypothetical protein
VRDSIGVLDQCAQVRFHLSCCTDLIVPAFDLDMGGTYSSSMRLLYIRYLGVFGWHSHLTRAPITLSDNGDLPNDLSKADLAGVAVLQLNRPHNGETLYRRDR